MSLNLPLLFSETKSIFLIAQPSGDLYFWNSLCHILDDSSSYSRLSGHHSMVVRLLFEDKKDEFISAGMSDGLIIEWGIKETIADRELGEDEEALRKEGLSLVSKKSEKKKANGKFIGMQNFYKEELRYLKDKVTD